MRFSPFANIMEQCAGIKDVALHLEVDLLCQAQRYECATAAMVEDEAWFTVRIGPTVGHMLTSNLVYLYDVHPDILLPGRGVEGIR